MIRASRSRSKASTLVLAKTVDNSTPNEGATVTYTVQLTNNGPDAATTIVVTDIVPAGLTYVGREQSPAAIPTTTAIPPVRD